MIFLSADHHLGDSRLEILGRPHKDTSELYYDLMNKHNSKVSNNDTVIFVGDVISSFSKDKDYWIDRLTYFNGKKKILIRGNHDRDITDVQFSRYFDTIIPEGDGLEMELGGIKCWITHYPSRCRSDMFNVTAHVHGIWRLQKNMYNCGLDVNHFYPVPECKIPFYYNAVQTFYDEDAWAYNQPANKNHESRGKKGTYFGTYLENKHT